MTNNKPQTITIDEVKYIRADSVQTAPDMSGDFSIIRCDRSGVFAGIITKEEGNTATVINVRRLWYWSGAMTLSQLALEGTKNPNECKFTAPNPEIRLKDVIEILPCTKKAEESILGVKVWSV